MYIFSALLLAWFLTWFSFDEIVINAIDELFNKHITSASYYFMFFIVGAIADIVGLF